MIAELKMYLFLPPATKLRQGNIFRSVCQEFCWGGVVSQHALQQVSKGGVVSQHAMQVSRPIPKGEVEGDLAGGGLQAHTQGGSGPQLGSLSQHALRQTPPTPQELLLRAVRILLECILVNVLFRVGNPG